MQGFFSFHIEEPLKSFIHGQKMKMQDICLVPDLHTNNAFIVWTKKTNVQNSPDLCNIAICLSCQLHSLAFFFSKITTVEGKDLKDAAVNMGPCAKSSAPSV